MKYRVTYYVQLDSEKEAVIEGEVEASTSELAIVFATVRYCDAMIEHDLTKAFKVEVVALGVPYDEARSAELRADHAGELAPTFQLPKPRNNMELVMLIAANILGSGKWSSETAIEFVKSYGHSSQHTRSILVWKPQDLELDLSELLQE